MPAKELFGIYGNIPPMLFPIYHIDLRFGTYTRHDSVSRMADVRKIIDSETARYDRPFDELTVSTSWGAGPTIRRLHRKKETA